MERSACAWLCWLVGLGLTTMSCVRVEPVDLAISLPSELAGQTLRVELYVVAAEGGGACPDNAALALMWRDSHPAIHEQSFRTDELSMVRRVGQLGATRHLFLTVARDVRECRIAAYGCVAADASDSSVRIVASIADGPGCDVGVPCDGNGRCGGTMMMPDGGPPCGPGSGGFDCCPSPVAPRPPDSEGCGNPTVLRENGGACVFCSDEQDIWAPRILSGFDGDRDTAGPFGDRLAMALTADEFYLAAQTRLAREPGVDLWYGDLRPGDEMNSMRLDFRELLSGASVIPYAAALDTTPGGPPLLVLFADSTGGAGGGMSGALVLTLPIMTSMAWQSIGATPMARLTALGGVTMSGTPSEPPYESRRLVFLSTPPGVPFGGEPALYSWPLAPDGGPIMPMQSMPVSTPWSMLSGGLTDPEFVGTRQHLVFWADGGGLNSWASDWDGSGAGPDIDGPIRFPTDVEEGRFDLASHDYPRRPGANRRLMVALPSACGVGLHPIVCTEEGSCREGIDFGGSGGSRDARDFAWSGRAERMSIVKIRNPTGEGYAIAWSIARPGGGHIFYLGFIRDDGTSAGSPSVLWQSDLGEEVNDLELRTTRDGPLQHFAVGVILGTAIPTQQKLVLLGATIGRCGP